MTATPGAAKSPASRILSKDAELKLDVAGLSAFEAMKATMKELGFDEDEQYEDDDYEGEAEEGEEGASPEVARKILKWGDAELKLDVEGLSAYEAMKATMKELGYDEDAEGEEGEEGEEATRRATRRRAAAARHRHRQCQRECERIGDALAVFARAGAGSGVGAAAALAERPALYGRARVQRGGGEQEQTDAEPGDGGGDRVSSAASPPASRSSWSGPIGTW